MAITQKSSSLCTVRLDRLRFSAEPRGGPKVPAIEGFRVLQDFRARPQGRIPTYARVKKLRSGTTSCQIVIQYKPQQGWLPPYILTIVGDDNVGITPEVLAAVRTSYYVRKLSLVELALDFDPSAGVDREYVLRHGVFGKTRRRTDRGGPENLRYGSRSSPKIVRCYAKTGIEKYRVELEIHGALLRKMGIIDIPDLYLIASKALPKHVRVVGIRWRKLEAYLLRRFGTSGRTVLAETRRIRDEISLRDAMVFLSAKGVMNPHRFLRPLRLNEEIKSALRLWAKRFYTQEELPVK